MERTCKKGEKEMNEKTVFGTQEWAKYNENCISGCTHDCKYCYAKSIAIRMKRKTPDNWNIENIKNNKLAKSFRKSSGTFMFPTAHDITPNHLDECLSFLENILRSGNEVLVVSKPHLECISKICDLLPQYKHHILFRFTIGSTDSAVIKFWEPGAPDFDERLAALKYAFDMGYKTSVSCEPMLDENIDELIFKVSPYVTDSIWLGKMNYPGARLALNGTNDDATLSTMNELMSIQSDGWIMKLYSRYKDNPQIKWKESIKKAVGLEIPMEKGLDV